VLDGLEALVDHSLVRQREESGAARFSMFQVIRDYALEQLEQSAEAEALRRAHLAYCLALAEEVEPWLRGGPRMREALVRLDRERDNLRAALDWTRGQRQVALGLRLAGAVSGFWRMRGPLSEGREWLDGLLALQATSQAATGAGHTTIADDAVPARVRAKALYGAGDVATYQGYFSHAEPLLEQSLVLARAAGEVVLTVLALNRLGLLAQYQGDAQRATAWYEECLVLARGLGDPLYIAMSLQNLALAAYAQGNLQQAETHIATAVAQRRQAGEDLWLPHDLALWAHIRRRQGDLLQAFRLLREAFTILHDMDELAWPQHLESLACTLAEAGHGEEAARLLGASAARRAAIGSPMPIFNQVLFDAAVAPARAMLGEAVWATAFAAGWALTLEEANTEALDIITEALIETP
jgi:tetratricopeptide (TPR) repeat protein